MDVNRNHFELFGLPQGFEVDTEALGERYRELQREAHPDRHAAGSDSERLESVQLAALINEGYRILKDPLARARYLLELNGVAMNDETDTTVDPAFLMEQMELRERLEGMGDEADPIGALGGLITEIEARTRALHEALRAQFEAGELQAARENVRKLQFLRRIREEADELDEELADTL